MIRLYRTKHKNETTLNKKSAEADLCFGRLFAGVDKRLIPLAKAKFHIVADIEIIGHGIAVIVVVCVECGNDLADDLNSWAFVEMIFEMKFIDRKAAIMQVNFHVVFQFFLQVNWSRFDGADDLTVVVNGKGIFPVFWHEFFHLGGDDFFLILGNIGHDV